MPHADYIRHPDAWTGFLAHLKRLNTQANKRLFISYAWESDVNHRHTQQAWLKQLQSDLEAVGFRVFLDVADMTGDMSDAMRQHIESSQAAIIIGSPTFLQRASNDKTNVAFELRLLLERAAAKQLILYPLCYEGAKMTEAFPLLYSLISSAIAGIKRLTSPN